MRDTKWHTQTALFGWHMRGIWPEDADGTDINACARSNTGKRQLLATADDFGKVSRLRRPSTPFRTLPASTPSRCPYPNPYVPSADLAGPPLRVQVKLFRYPAIVPRADHRPYGGHSSHVTNLGFTHNDHWLLSAGGDDRAVFQWEVSKE